MVAQPGFFDLEDRLARLSAKGDELERLSAVVDFELFRAAAAHTLILPHDFHAAFTGGVTLIAQW